MQHDSPAAKDAGTPSAEAEHIVMQRLAGEVPDWYRNTVTDGYALWNLWRSRPSLPALANLVEQFGGLCDWGWIRSPLEPDLFPSIHVDPFGNC